MIDSALTPPKIDQEKSCIVILCNPVNYMRFIKFSQWIIVWLSFYLWYLIFNIHKVVHTQAHAWMCRSAVWHQIQPRNTYRFRLPRTRRGRPLRSTALPSGIYPSFIAPVYYNYPFSFTTCSSWLLSTPPSLVDIHHHLHNKRSG